VATPGLDTRLEHVLGGRSAGLLRRYLDLTCVEDLLRHYPRRYARRGELTDLSQLRVGEHVTVTAKVVSATVESYVDRKNPRKVLKRADIVVSDGNGRLLLTFFRQPYLVDRLRPGTEAMFAGQVNDFRGKRQLLHPDYQVLDAETGDGSGGKSRLERPLIPIYPATAKVSSWTIGRCVEQALDSVEAIADPVPNEVLDDRRLLGLAAALDKIHRPLSREDYEAARRRLRFEEAFVLQTVLALGRQRIEHLLAKPRPPVSGGLRERFDAQLPFALTSGQVEVGDVISADLARLHPMHRLLQGEVGSGKTVVALRAMLQVVDAGGQAALLAPTEVLAQQHHRSITAMLGDLALGGMLGGADDGTRVALLTGSASAAGRRSALLDAGSGAAGIVVGTHALLEGDVRFADLGLVVVDEQHRFGVEQRAALAAKGDQARPHVLVMTATPIPRTVAMTVFGDLETSTLRELPSGRQPIQTTVVPQAERPHWLDRTWERVSEEVGRGRQTYVVCPRIGDGTDDVPDSDDDALVVRRTAAATELAESLATGPLGDVRVALLHGRLPPEAKDDVMARFGAGDIDVLVSTTVIEVGVDVPNASVMVVMDADRFGVSQLHQLRGRVGRGTVPGLCLLVTTAPEGTPARERLDAVAATTDGFALSALDLKLRREGDVLGASQSGRRSSLRLLSVIEHEDVISDARTAAAQTVAADPELAQHAALAAVVEDLERSARAEYLEKT